MLLSRPERHPSWGVGGAQEPTSLHAGGTLT